MVWTKSAGAKAVKQTSHPSRESRTRDQAEIYEASDGDIYTMSIALSAKHNPCSMLA
jgi:hypothetical protein